MSSQYFQDITNVPELIPDLADIVSEYTGGYCDSKTEGGKTCWSHHQDCDQVCLGNLESWLKPKFLALLGKPLTSNQDGEILERYSNVLENVDYLIFPPSPYKVWRSDLRLEINHPTIGQFSLRFSIRSDKRDDFYIKIIQLFLLGNNKPRLVQNYLSKHQQNFKENFMLHYNNDAQWQTLAQNIISLYQDLEDLLYFNNTTPLQISADFKLHSAFVSKYEDDYENDRYVDLRVQVMNYLFHSEEEEKVTVNNNLDLQYEDDLPDYKPVENVTMDILNKKARQFEFAFNSFDFGELKPFVQVDDYRGFSYTVSFTATTDIQYQLS